VNVETDRQRDKETDRQSIDNYKQENAKMDGRMINDSR